jgi:hypothetical protein
MSVKASQLNFVHVQPNSQFYTDLKQIETSLMHNMDRDHILVGIQNTIKMGFKLTAPRKRKRKR